MRGRCFGSDPRLAARSLAGRLAAQSPKGGQPPLDPASDAPDTQTDDTRRLEGDAAARNALANTIKLSDVDLTAFDAVFYPGGHGPLWDLAEDLVSIHLIEYFAQGGKPIAAVCHAPAIFRHTKAADGKPLLSGRNVTGFTNSEEAAVGLTDVVPFLVEDMLAANGGVYSKGADWASHVVVDGKLVTGQNPASSKEAAMALVTLLA